MTGIAILAAAVLAQVPEQAPHAVGRIDADLATGRFRGDVCLSNRPAAGARRFSLNAGLNVTRVTDGTGAQVNFDGWYSPGVDGEARVYTLTGIVPDTLCVAYVGELPVYAFHDAPIDFKGVIAFNGDSVRATEQAAWLPTAYDGEGGRRYDVTTFDLSISCSGCRFLYMGGSPPIERTQARFVSHTPRPPLLFGGNGPISRAGDLTVLNEAVPDSEVSSLAATLEQVEGFYGRYLASPMKERPTLLRMTMLDQVARDRQGKPMAFATWPTVAVSRPVRSLAADTRSTGQAGDDVLQYLAHETAHYYFGFMNDGSGPFRQLLVEGAAEYMSIQALAAIRGPEVAARRESVLVGQLVRKSGYQALDTFAAGRNPQKAHDFAYEPLMLLALQREIGEPAMRNFMRALLAAPGPRDWNDLRAIALAGGVPPLSWERWQSNCVDDPSMKCLTTLAKG